MDIPFLNLEPCHSLIKHEMQSAFDRVYSSNWFILGEEVLQFEKEYAEFSNTQYAVGLSNGLDALILSLKALGIGPDHEVIVPSNTYIATVLAVTHTGATPVFSEPRIETYNIDPDQIKKLITPRTKAIIPVHLYGQPCEMNYIMQIADEYGLYIIEDNAQGHGSKWQNRITGSFGHCNATSFYPGKNLGALGDAGCITTSLTELADKIRILRNYGSKKKYYNDAQGYNNRLDELQAAFLRVKLKYLESWNSERIKIAAWYDELLMPIDGITTPYKCPEAIHTYHLYVIRTAQRDKIQNKLNDAGIQTLIHYPVPPYEQKAFSKTSWVLKKFPIADELSKTVLSLPIWPGMNREMVERIVQIIIDK